VTLSIHGHAVLILPVFLLPGKVPSIIPFLKRFVICLRLMMWRNYLNFLLFTFASKLLSLKNNICLIISNDRMHSTLWNNEHSTSCCGQGCFEEFWELIFARVWLPCMIYLKPSDLSSNCFRQQLKTFLFCKYWHQSQHYFHALETLLMCSTNAWYLLTYLLAKHGDVEIDKGDFAQFCV